MYSINPEEHLKSKGIIDLNKKSDVEVKQNENIVTDESFKMEMAKNEFELMKEEHEWRSCCFSLHRESSLFFAKLIISIMIISLCGFQLITLTNCNYQSLYSSILSSVLTYWLNHKNK